MTQSTNPHPATPLTVVAFGFVIVLGAVLISAVLCLAQTGSVLFTGVSAVIWFLIGTQKAGWLESVDPGWGRTLLSAGLAWLPDFALLSPGPFADTSTGPGLFGTGLGIVYGILFVSLYLLLAAILVRLQWAGSRPGKGRLASAIRRLR